jgi:hypothetical protein
MALRGIGDDRGLLAFVIIFLPCEFRLMGKLKQDLNPTETTM